MIIEKTISFLRMNNIFLKFFLKLEGYSYRKIDSLSILVNGGVHPKHEIMKYHDFFVENIKSGSSVLDIGCGIGAVAFDVAKKAKKVVAVDLDKKNLDIASKKFSVKNIEYVYADATTYNFKEKFDYIILSNVLEHIDKRVEFLKKIKKLAPIILIRVPMINRDWLTLYRKEMGLPYLSDNGHFTEYTLETFQEEMKQADLKIKKYSIQFGEIWAVVRR